MPITHAFTSAAAAASDASLVDGPKWNAGHSGLVTGFLPSDHAGVSNATLVNTPLVVAVSSGVTYAFRYYIVWRTTLATVGLKLGLTTPAFTVYAATVRHVIAADGTAALFTGALTTSGDSVIGTAAPVANTDYLSVIEGIIRPSANGSLTVQYAAETTGATVTMRAGSGGVLVTL